MAIDTYGVVDDHLFLMSMPKKAACCYERICHPTTGIVPTSERILQDVRKVITALQVIYDAEGVYVPSLADGRTAGHRHTATNDDKKQRGGKRVRLEYNHTLATRDIHLDLLTTLDEFDKDNTSLHYSLRLLEDGQDEIEDEAM